MGMAINTKIGLELTCPAIQLVETGFYAVAMAVGDIEPLTLQDEIQFLGYIWRVTIAPDGQNGDLPFLFHKLPILPVVTGMDEKIHLRKTIHDYFQAIFIAMGIANNPDLHSTPLIPLL